MEPLHESGRHVWSHPETLALIDAWEERYDILKSQRRTAHVHEEIKQALSALGIEKSIRQIVVKIDNLTQKYRKTRTSGKLNPTWIYYRRLEKFLGYPTRYRSRRLEPTPDDTESEDITEPPIIPDEVRTNVAISDEPDSTLLDLSQYQQELLDIVAHQFEVQKQSLAVQEKLIWLLKKGPGHGQSAFALQNVDIKSEEEE